MSSVLPTTSSSTASPAATASSLITSTGIGSGLNISSIVSTLTTAYGAAENAQLSSQQTSLNAQVSAFGTFSSAISTLQATLAALETPTALAGFTAGVADKSIASATASSSAVAGQYSLAVQNLATPQILTSAPVASGDTAVGSGTLNITVGSTTAAINIDSSNNTLSDIASAINSATNNPGVTANIITTTDGARLVLTGTSTGQANSITVTQSGGDGGLAALTYDPTNNVTNLTQTQLPTNANFTINGYAATSASNVVTGAITGVTLHLLGASAQVTPATTPASYTPTTLTVAADTSGAQTSIGSFVTAVNGVLSAIQSLTSYNASTGTAGPLLGNATLESFQNQLQNILNTVTTSSSGVSSLASLGITANTQGTYSSNTTTLGNTLSSSLSGVANLLSGSNGIASKIDALVTQYTQAGGLLATINQGLQSGLTNVATQQTALNARLAAYSATLTSEYNAMDAAVALLKQTQTYLTAEFNPQSAATTSSSTSLGSGNVSTG
jgi:flagellar hook-associated protein 2